MSELADIVSDSLSGNTFVTIQVGKRQYRINAPTPFILSRMLKPLSQISVNDEETHLSATTKIGSLGFYLAQSIALAVIGDRPLHPFNRMRLYRLARKIHRQPLAWQKDALEKIVSVIDAQAFFYCARLAMELTKMMVKPKS